LTLHRLPHPPIDRLIISVTQPIVIDRDGEFVGGVLFRQAHDVIPTPVDEGIAYFGTEWFEENTAGLRVSADRRPPRTGLLPSPGARTLPS
jgi:hypothetical protein